MVLHLNKLESPSPKDALCQFGWNWPSGFWEEVNRKSLQMDGQTDRETDRQTANNRRAEKLTWAFSSGELKTTVTKERKVMNRNQSLSKCNTFLEHPLWKKISKYPTMALTWPSPEAVRMKSCENWRSLIEQVQVSRSWWHHRYSGRIKVHI